MEEFSVLAKKLYFNPKKKLFSKREGANEQRFDID
jgi:hypothetical protein